MAPNSSKTQSEPSRSHYRELWALLSFLGAVFVFVHNRAPQSTGWIGRWVMEGAFKHLVGQGVYFSPLFLICVGVALLISKRSGRFVFFSSSMLFINFVIFLELIVHSEPKGGWIGQGGLFVLQKAVGYNGTWIFLIGSFLVSAVVFFNVSIRDVLRWIFTSPAKATDNWAEPIPKKSVSQAKSLPQESRFKKWIYALFYETRAVDEAFPPMPLPIKEKKDSLPIRTPQQLDPLLALEPELDEPEPLKKPEPSRPMPIKKMVSNSDFELPPLDLLDPPKAEVVDTKAVIQKRKENAALLEAALASFQVEAKVVHITPGPSVTRYELQPGDGVKIIKFTALSKDIALKLAVPDVRIEAPIPGKALIGIEVPNAQIETVVLRGLIDKSDFVERPSKLLCAMGLTITGEPILMDLAKMPHILIAGATGSGKSVCVNTIIISILLRATPDEVKFLMIDPKKVELSLYEGIPHLIAPVVTNPHKAAATLKQWALLEMERRYSEFSRVGVKEIEGYNSYVLQNKDKEPNLEKIPYIVVIIDELADLMMVASQDVESTICRLAQMSRATGIHLVIATQRPSVNVITGLIKANVPSRISFFLQSQIDSRTILDMPGAEKLLGKGDMLYSPVGSFKPKRVQGIYVSEKEVKAIVSFLKAQATPEYSNEILDVEPLPETSKESGGDSKDELFEEAKNIVINTRYASTSYLQRKLRIGYNRAARLMDELTEAGVIAEYAGEKKAREML